MLLSIDKVLQLLAEEKSVEKIAQMANCENEDVVKIINDARGILVKYEKPRVKKKIIIKKSVDPANNQGENPDADQGKDDDIFRGAELSAVPLGSTLTIYTDGVAEDKPGPAGIGIVIHDKEGVQVGKVSYYLGNKFTEYARYYAIERALQIAAYFETRVLKVRSSSEKLVKQLNGQLEVNNPAVQKIYNEVMLLSKKIKNCKFELVTKIVNEKAGYLAELAIQSHQEQ
ncbi:MAG: reverse transcriptase-like protein [bacterium]|nr:reverse transcriptase-like protein [bacterium]